MLDSYDFVIHHLPPSPSALLEQSMALHCALHIVALILSHVPSRMWTAADHSAIRVGPTLLFHFKGFFLCWKGVYGISIFTFRLIIWSKGSCGYEARWQINCGLNCVLWIKKKIIFRLVMAGWTWGEHKRGWRRPRYSYFWSWRSFINVKQRITVEFKKVNTDPPYHQDSALSDYKLILFFPYTHTLSRSFPLLHGLSHQSFLPLPWQSASMKLFSHVAIKRSWITPRLCAKANDEWMTFGARSGRRALIFCTCSKSLFEGPAPQVLFFHQLDPRVKLG